MRKSNFNWKKKKILVTGGASFIGSHLVDQLVELGAFVRVVDDLSSGKKENIKSHLKKKSIEFRKADLRDPGVARKVVKGMNIVIHFAGDHGGRGYIDLHQAGPASNLMLDGLVFWESLKNDIEKVVFASSGCVYPKYLQNNQKKIYLTEDMVRPPHDADNIYGYAKLMGEMVLKSYYQEYGLKTASCRFFTVYGPRGKEDHAVIAMIAKAFIGQNPFEVWGNGTQIRNWTYVSDIISGVILAAEKIDDGNVVNLGTMERIKILDAVKEVLRYTGHRAQIKLLPHMPTGPLNRVASNKLAKKVLDWEPQVKFMDGLHTTIDWYFKVKNRNEVKRELAKMLLSR